MADHPQNSSHRDIDKIVSDAQTGKPRKGVLKGTPRGKTAIDRRINKKRAERKSELSRLRAAQTTDSNNDERR